MIESNVVRTSSERRQHNRSKELKPRRLIVIPVLILAVLAGMFSVMREDPSVASALALPCNLAPGEITLGEPVSYWVVLSSCSSDVTNANATSYLNECLNQDMVNGTCTNPKQVQTIVYAQCIIPPDSSRCQFPSSGFSEYTGVTGRWYKAVFIVTANNGLYGPATVASAWQRCC